MENSPAFHASPSVLSVKTFDRFAAIIQSQTGIRMPSAKRTMLQSRLQKRIRALSLNSFEAYLERIEEPDDPERIRMIDVVTTNKTDFFREPKHFSFLAEQAIPELVRSRCLSSSGKGLTIWSAGCSSGEEPYTLAMVLSEYQRAAGDLAFSILATDICTEVLQKAATAVYDHDRVAPVPMALRKRYLLRGRKKLRHLVRMSPEIRSKVTFGRLNFMDPVFDIGGPVQVIFCRNVIIYFDKPTQEALLNRFCRCLIPGGYLFLGHSETINDLKVPVRQVAPTIYRRNP